jgi:hypothetical protein
LRIAAADAERRAGRDADVLKPREREHLARVDVARQLDPQHHAALRQAEPAAGREVARHRVGHLMRLHLQRHAQPAQVVVVAAVADELSDHLLLQHRTCTRDATPSPEVAMLKFHGPVVLQLRDGELFRCDQACVVRVMQGRVWITQRHDPDDHFLDAGQALALRGGAQAIVGAEGAAQVALAALSRHRERARNVNSGAILKLLTTQ